VGDYLLPRITFFKKGIWTVTASLTGYAAPGGQRQLARGGHDRDGRDDEAGDPGLPELTGVGNGNLGHHRDGALRLAIVTRD
jgi:hypothetical protein